MSWSRVHRWLAIILVVPLVMWSVTGLLFHLKPGWTRAYDMLSAERPLATTDVAPINIVAGTLSAPIERIELFDTVLGPLYRVTTVGGAELVNAVGATRRSPLSADDARALANDAVARSTERSAYGEVAEVVLDDRVARVRFEGGPTVKVDRRTARLSQRGPDTERIDWLYRIHYLQLTGHRTVDQGIAIGGLALIWFVLIAGVVLFKRRWRD